MSDSQNVFQVATDRAELIEQLLEIGTALSRTNDLGEVLNLILTKCREITCSDAGSVYLIDHSVDVPSLLFKVAQNFSSPTTFREFTMPMTQKSLAGYVAITGNTLNLPDAYETPPDAPYQLDRSFDQSIHYRTRSVLILPMQNQRGDTIGVLQLINRKTSSDAIVTPENALTVTQPYSKWEERVLKSLASQAAISLERNQLHQSIENLFEGFVKASVQVIEARDPCTSGHSERVADLTVRLSEEVSAVSSGLLAPIAFNRHQIQEVRYAALLHDFGKVGVPEAVLVKAKKLYPLQLEVVKHRFALAQRTLEMECAQAKYRHLVEHPSHLLRHSNPSDSSCLHCQELEQLNAQSADAIAQLKYYWDILLEANEPRILSEEPLLQLKELARFTYRDLDGLEKPLVTPEEMEQLLVRRGNLTETEREAIQSHVTHTYEFLKRIPWTKDLQGVPLIAYGHHEKLDGSGYPRGLNEDEIPIQSQIMAIADIYDALTAGDRPYKRSLAISSSIQILKQEAKHNKLNTELVLLFEHRRVFSVLGHQLGTQA
ncbi:GAF domain-containing protein [Phormidium sp. CLA17]|uniref:HD domain-containing phosphohydrolase n=1 Tax=Leptolyngbya sp. Cla-17 TaxID=2803751 RepID=UPI001491D1D9|nr:HD domain-containing phosphohydrolase [Leptolyngbya sp. Cla-17]MBM0740542.1 GAF domain-containing protein [Leptolyngbya sp. Cla-17]